ncbi:MAG: sulfite exporter TauE/SafE family protein, partial [Candidatus Promineifilaceae bacterium]
MIIVALIVFLGALVQSSIGFGFALVTMPILVGVLGIHLAAPLVALTAMLLEITILLRYREAFNFGVVK